MSGKGIRRLAVVALLAFALGALGALIVLPDARTRIGRLLLPAPIEPAARVGGPFSLVDQTGRRVTERQFRGRHMLLTFGWTHSPDVTPAALQAMAAALVRIGNMAERVAPVLITLDPDRDGPAELAAYVARFHPRFVGLSGTPDEVAAAARAWHEAFRKLNEGERSGDYAIAHPALIYLMGPDGAYVTHFRPGTGAEAIARRLAAELS